MKQRKISKTNVVNFSTYLGMVIFFLVMTALSKAGVLNRSMTGLLVPICCYMSMAVSLNLTVGILGELSLGHAGFMSVGAFAGVIASQSLLDVVPSAFLETGSFYPPPAALRLFPLLGFPTHTLHPQGVCGIRKAAQPLTAALPYRRGEFTTLLTVSDYYAGGFYAYSCS